MYIYIYTHNHIPLSLSLSLYIYIYIYMCGFYYQFSNLRFNRSQNISGRSAARVASSFVLEALSASMATLLLTNAIGTPDPN